MCAQPMPLEDGNNGAVFVLCTGPAAVYPGAERVLYIIEPEGCRRTRTLPLVLLGALLMPFETPLRVWVSSEAARSVPGVNRLQQGPLTYRVSIGLDSAMPAISRVVETPSTRGTMTTFPPHPRTSRAPITVSSV